MSTVASMYTEEPLKVRYAELWGSVILCKNEFLGGTPDHQIKTYTLIYYTILYYLFIYLFIIIIYLCMYIIYNMHLAAKVWILIGRI